MYVHLGQDTVVSVKNIIAILDIEKTTVSKTTRNFLKIAEEEGFVEVISEEMPKSFVVCEILNKSKVYISPISSTTLQKRAKFMDKIKKCIYKWCI